MVAKLSLDGSVDLSHFFIEHHGIKFLHHGTRSEFTQASATAGAGAFGKFGGVFGKLEGRIGNLFLEVFQFELCFGTTTNQNMRGSGFGC